MIDVCQFLLSSFLNYLYSYTGNSQYYTGNSQWGSYVSDLLRAGYNNPRKGSDAGTSSNITTFNKQLELELFK